MDEILEWIKRGLDKPGKTQTGLAEALGRTQPQVSRLLRGTRDLKEREIAIIAEYLEEEPPPRAERRNWRQRLGIEREETASADLASPSEDFDTRLAAQREAAERLARNRAAAARLEG